jgi:DNA-binding CsgD family transcriptional regulator
MTTANDRTGQPLTTRELDVAIAIANGRPSQQIADQLRIGIDAAKAVISRLFDKAGVQPRERGHLLTVLFRSEVLTFDNAGRAVPGLRAEHPVSEAARDPRAGFWLFDKVLDGHELSGRYAAAVAQRNRWIAGKT